LYFTYGLNSPLTFDSKNITVSFKGSRHQLYNGFPANPYVQFPVAVVSPPHRYISVLVPVAFPWSVVPIAHVYSKFEVMGLPHVT